MTRVLTDEELEQINEELRINSGQFKNLDSSFNGIRGKKLNNLLKSLESNYELRKLSLEGNQIIGEDLKEIFEFFINGKNTSITDLDLTSNFFGKSLEEIQFKQSKNQTECKNSLKILRLRNNGIDDDGLQILIDNLFCHLQHLKELNIKSNNITQQGVDYLMNFLEKSSIRLETLNLNCNGVTFRRPLLHNSAPGLKHLKLGTNHIKDTGCTNLISFLQMNKSIKSLDLSGNGFTVQGLGIILKYLQGVKLSHLKLNFLRFSQGIQILLEYLGSDMGKQLKKLDLKEAFSDYADEESFPMFTSFLLEHASELALQELNLGNNCATFSLNENLFGFMKGPNTLRKLSLASCLISTSLLLFEVEKPIENLISLNLANNLLDDAGLKHLFFNVSNSSHTFMFPNLTELDLSSNGLEGSRCIILMKNFMNVKNCELRILKLAKNAICGDEACESIAEYLGSPNQKLEFLDLSYNAVDTEGLEKICAGLEGNKTLEVLDLESNAFHEEGEPPIVDLLRKRNYSLKNLGFDNNNHINVALKRNTMFCEREKHFSPNTYVAHNLGSNFDDLAITFGK